MDRFWKWLTGMDARGIFIASLLLFLLVSGWWGWKAFRPQPAPAVVAPAAQPVELPPYKPLGILAFVSNQFAPGALVVPVNPFRPTFEAMISNRASEVVQSLQNGTPSGRPPLDRSWAWLLRRSQPSGRRQQSATQSSSPETSGESPPPPPSPPTLTYRGMLERPDGTIAAFLHDSARGAGRFVNTGDRLYNIEVAAVHKGGITLRLADGSLRTLARGDAITLGDPAP